MSEIEKENPDFLAGYKSLLAAITLIVVGAIIGMSSIVIAHNERDAAILQQTQIAQQAQEACDNSDHEDLEDLIRQYINQTERGL